ncbi:hypothetical protein ABLO27_25020 [Roseibium sp. SCPC15]|uniref:hypothetical protein n=1 Tax=Roseibium sp. SCP15 TaxID=3141376 RepID=UPI003338E982
MSSTANISTLKAPRLETVVIAVICVIVLAVGAYLVSQRQQALRSSPAGHDGLQVWLTSSGLSARNFIGGWPMDQTAVGLLVVPLYDTALDKDRALASSKEELLQQQDEYDLDLAPILEKAQRAQTLVILPKWRTGMRLTGRAHPVLRAEPNRLAGTLGKLLDDNQPELIFPEVPFTEFDYQSANGDMLQAKIYAAQLFKARGCTPLIGAEEAMLLGDCALGETAANGNERVLVLSDPDLLNNHGLRLGDNARIAVDFLGAKAGDRNIIIDYSRASWLRDPAREPERERTWADLLRFFDQPFLTLWIGSATLFLLFLWRAAFRYGPISPDTAKPGASKSLAIRARARLMRLSGQDGALTAEYAAARIAATAESLFGVAHARHFTNEDEFLKYVERRHAPYAPRLKAVLSEIRKLPAHLPAHEAIHHIDELEQVLEQITHDA